jgi:hypothetical protein
MTDFVMTKLDPNTDKVTAAECTKVYHIVQHEHSYPDSDIMTKLSCPGTKAKAKTWSFGSCFCL